MQQHTRFLKAENKGDLEHRCQCLGCLTGYGIGIGIEQLTLSVMGKRSQNGNNTLFYQAGQEYSVHTLDITHKTVVNILYRTFIGTHHVAVRAGQANGVYALGLQSGHNVLVYQASIDHSHHVKHFGIGNATAVNHLALYSQT